MPPKPLAGTTSVIDGKGNATDSANALQQAIALKPDGIILGCDRSAVQQG